MSFINFAQARRLPAIVQAARDIGLNEPELRAAIIDEADNGSPATWARRAPGVNGGDLSLQVDVDLAIAASFVKTS